MENKFGLLGRSLSHSWSARIHALLCGYDYQLYEKEPEALEPFLRTTDLAGMNVTIPYKKTVLPYCRELSDAARHIGSVNTLVRRNGSWYGDNTDYAGFVTMVKHCGVSVTGQKALVFGSGGASLAVTAALQDMGAAPVISISRSGAENYDNLDRHSDAEILVNTTPLGMYPNTGTSPVSLDRFPACRAVLDVVYNPLRTKLLMDAELIGISHAGGLTMLVAQARRSAELFSGKTIPDERVFEIVSALEAEMQNIILIGMPGCGKTTVGQALASALDRPLIDTDEEITKTAAMSIPAIFAAEGEEGFRARETAVLEAVGKRSGAVIATGGGCITRQENYPLLHQNGLIVWLKRSLDTLPTDGRPLSQATPAQALFEARKENYQSFSDAVVENDSEPSCIVQRIMEIIK